MPKDLGGVLASKLRDTQLIYFHYLKMVWGAPVGTLRWTTYPTYPAQFDSRDIDGSLQSWDGSQVWEPVGLQEGEQTSVSISDITFGNADRNFTDRMTLATGGIKAVAVTLWTAFFDKDDVTTLDSKFTRFVGYFDRAEASGESVRVSLIAGKHPMNLVFPRRRFNVAHGFKWIPPPNTKIAWGSNIYEAPAASPRQTGADPPSGGGGEPPGNIGPPTIEPRMRPVLANPRGGRPREVTRSDEPSPPPRDPRTVTR